MEVSRSMDAELTSLYAGRFLWQAARGQGRSLAERRRRQVMALEDARLRNLAMRAEMSASRDDEETEPDHENKKKESA